MKECSCSLCLDCCDLDNPRCADFYRATYAEIEAGLWDVERAMLADLEMWRAVAAAENEPPMELSTARGTFAYVIPKGEA